MPVHRWWFTWLRVISSNATTTHHNCFTAIFLGPPGWADARNLLDFMMQGKINTGRHTDHPAGRNSIRTNQCQPPPSPHFLQAGCPSCRPANSVKALKATKSSEGRWCWLPHLTLRVMFEASVCDVKMWKMTAVVEILPLLYSVKLLW